MIGQRLIPEPLQEQMNEAPILVLEAGLSCRVENIRNEYVVGLWHELLRRTGDQAEASECHRGRLLACLDAIRKRLGGANHRDIRAMLEHACAQQAPGRFEAHDAWIEQLLVRYYDPMYDYQLETRSNRIRLAGTAAEICNYATTMFDSGRIMA